jgi:integrase/recombinase XerD
MTNKTISPLRQRMIEDMTFRSFTAKTQSDYIRSVRNLAAFLGRSPDTATAEDLRRFQLHLTETRIRPPTINGTVSALRFFFTEAVSMHNEPRPRGSTTRANCPKGTGIGSAGGLISP